MDAALRVGPLERHRGAQLMEDPQGVHGELVHGDLPGCLRQAAGGGEGEDRLGVGPVCHRQLHHPLAHQGVGQGAHRAEADGALDVGVLGEQVGLVLCQAGVEDVAGGAVGVLIVEQETGLHRAAQQKHKGVQPGHQGGGQHQNGVFDPMEVKVPANQPPAHLQIVVCKHGRTSLRPGCGRRRCAPPGRPSGRSPGCG